MKRTLLLTLIFLLSFAKNSFSQEYHPLLNNPSWIVNDWVSCCRAPEIQTIEEGTDIVIGSYTYKQFNDPFPQYDSTSQTYINTVCLREDIAEKKVYKIVNGTDVLLYDFSLENGDVILQYGNTFTVTAVDDITVNGGTRKRITLHSTELYCDEALTQVWIEGVGTDKHPFYPDHNMYSVCSSGGGIQIHTKCSFQNGQYVYGDSDYCSHALGIDEKLPASQKISFSPNPFTTELTIQSEVAFEDATVKLYDVLGKLVSESFHQSGNKLKLNRGNLNSGFYFLQLLDKGKLVKTAKIMIE